MAGNFTQFSKQERQYSDITPVRTAVADTSSATALSGLVQGVSSLAGVGLEIYGHQKEVREQEQKMEQQEALTGHKKDFEDELIRAKEMARQHGATSNKFDTFITQAFRASPLDLETKSKMMKDFQATVLGKSFTELSPEEKAEQEMVGDAYTQGFIGEGYSPDEQAEGMAEYRKYLATIEAQAADMRALDLEAKRVAGNATKSAEVAKRRGDAQLNGVVNLSVHYRPVVRNKILEIINNFKGGKLSREDAEGLLQAAKGDLVANIALASSEIKNKESVKAITGPLTGLYDVALANITSEKVLENINHADKVADARLKVALKIDYPELRESNVLSNLFGNASPGQLAKAANLSARIMQDLEKGRVADITVEDEEVKAVLDIVEENAKKLDKLTESGAPIVDMEEFTAVMNSTLNSANKYIDEGDSPVDNKNILKWLASPNIGNAIQEIYPNLDEGARTELSSTLTKSAVNHIYPKVQEILSSELKESEAGSVELSKVGKTAVFRPTTGDMWAKSVAQKLNREVGGALTTYFNAIGNVSGEGFESVFNRENDGLFSEQEEQEGQAVTYPDNEGMIGTDPDGNKFIILNGEPVPYKGGADGT